MALSRRGPSSSLVALVRLPARAIDGVRPARAVRRETPPPDGAWVVPRPRAQACGGGGGGERLDFSTLQYGLTRLAATDALAGSRGVCR